MKITPNISQNLEAKRQISLRSLLVKRQNVEPVINSLSKKFQIFYRPGKTETCDESSTFKGSNVSYDFKNTGFQRFYSRENVPVQDMACSEFPNIRRKKISKPCKGQEEVSQKMVPYEKRIQVYNDLTSLEYLDSTNKDLRSQIKRLSKTIERIKISSSPIVENPQRIDPRKRAKSQLKYVGNKEKAPVTDPNWQKIIRRSAGGFSLTLSKHEKHLRVDKGIINASYPYCKFCNKDWSQLIE